MDGTAVVLRSMVLQLLVLQLWWNCTGGCAVAWHRPAPQLPSPASDLPRAGLSTRAQRQRALTACPLPPLPFHAPAQGVQSKLSLKQKKKGRSGGDDGASDGSGSDSDEEDDFLEGEEDGGDGGLGADPGVRGEDP